MSGEVNNGKAQMAMPVYVVNGQEPRRLSFEDRVGNGIGLGIENAISAVITNLVLGALSGIIGYGRDLIVGNPKEKAKQNALAHEEILIAMSHKECGGYNFNDAKVKEIALNALVELKRTDIDDYKAHREHFSRCLDKRWI